MPWKPKNRKIIKRLNLGLPDLICKNCGCSTFIYEYTGMLFVKCTLVCAKCNTVHYVTSFMRD